MRSRVWLAAWLAIGFSTTTVSAAAPLQLDAGRLGRLDVVVPDGAVQGLVFLLSGDDGITLEIEGAATGLAERGIAVAPVDTPAWLRRMRDVPGRCLYLVSDLEEASRQIQARLGTPHYLSPVVVGTGSGSAVAYAALAQAPAATLDGAASDGFTTFIATDRPLCPGAAATAARGGFTYAPTADLPGWWRVGSSADQLAAARTFLRTGGLDGDEDSLSEVKPGMTLAERVTQLVGTRIRATIEAASPLNDLPLIELPAAGPGQRMAVIWSGDGGWRDLDKQIGERLAAEGVPVVGVDTLRYFWSAKPPEAMAADLAAIIEHYAEAWNRPEVLLVGYSFGADVLPFAYNRLSQPARTRVRQLSLLALSAFADFEIHVSGWLSSGRHPDSVDTAPELARLDGVAVQCFYGAEEADTACTLPELKGAQIIRTAGGHHFDGDYAALARRILAGRD